MFCHERQRNLDKAVSEGAIAFPDAVGMQSRQYKRHRFSRRRVMTLLVRLLAICSLVLLCLLWYQRSYVVRSASPQRPPQLKSSRLEATPPTISPGKDHSARVDATATAAGAATQPQPQPSSSVPSATTTTRPTEYDPRTTRLHTFRGDRTNQREEGEYAIEEPERLPGLQLRRQVFSPAQLLDRFQNTTYIYTFVNGSELNHEYRKEVRNGCIQSILTAETESYNRVYPIFLRPTTPAPTNATALNWKVNGTSPGIAVFSTAAPQVNPFKVLQCAPNRLRNAFEPGCTLGDLLMAVRNVVHKAVDNRDRETDELRHSIRSLEQHVRWHRGRVVIVSPGHHPTWVDGAKNFLAGACGDASVQALRLRGTHLRLTTVHQDALMPYGLRFTADSHVIEQHIWRVRNITPVHVYMNDDYFVNRDVAITDLFNEYGGTMVRTESGILNFGAVAGNDVSWEKGVLHTQQFNIIELDVHREDYLPESLIAMWVNLGRLDFSGSPTRSLPVVRGANLNDAVDIGRKYNAEPMLSEPQRPRRQRRYATHAPFVYCTNMFRFFETRYEREFSLTALKHRSRKAADLFIPFLYNAFVMARPWQASPQFLPYLLQLHRSRNATPTEAPPSVEISLDNFDGCAPASLRGGWQASECTYTKFEDNTTVNDKTIARIASANPLYFNINAGFSSDAAASQLREFLHDKFPTPIYLEQSSPSTTVDPEDAGAGGDEENATRTTTTTTTAANAVLTPTFDALMALPVVGVVSYEEGVCPLVRSLSLAFAGHHRGRVHVAVQRHGLGEAGEADESLRETRRRLGHRVFSAIPVPKCAFGSLVSVGPANRTEALADVALRALRESGGAGVELPSTCGHSGDNDAAAAGAGLRVRGFVIDARTPSAPVKSVGALRDALAMPGQTLALEDFRAVRVGPEDRDVVLVLAREDADAKAVHWITGASENDLLVTYPLPVEAYENMTAELQWSEP